MPTALRPGSKVVSKALCGLEEVCNGPFGFIGLVSTLGLSGGQQGKGVQGSRVVRMFQITLSARAFLGVCRQAGRFTRHQQT